MADLALKRQSDGSFDLDFQDSANDLELDDGLYNAIVISVGTYARERKLSVNKANVKPLLGGWWADSIDDKGTLGGYLYEAFPGKLDDATAKKVAALAAESLQWLKDDGIAHKIECAAHVEGKNIVLTTEIYKPDGENKAFEFELNWIATNGI